MENLILLQKWRNIVRLLWGLQTTTRRKGQGKALHINIMIGHNGQEHTSDRLVLLNLAAMEGR